MPVPLSPMGTPARELRTVAVQPVDNQAVADARRVADAIRRRVLAHVIANQGGYLSQACSSAEILATLYTAVLRLGPSEGPAQPEPFAGVPNADRPTRSGSRYNGAHAPDLDRFFFSPVHYALVLYAALIEVGRLGPDALDTFNQDGSTVELIGAEHSPGMETMAGSLAQCLSQAGGVALARRMKGHSGRTWVFLSDGECQEGQIWEAFQALAFHQLDHVAVVIDANGFQCDGPMTGVMGIEPLGARLQAFGARVVEIDGHDPQALIDAAQLPFDGRPLAVVCRTDPCHGIELLRQRAPKLHYVRLQNATEEAQYQQVLSQWEAQ